MSTDGSSNLSTMQSVAAALFGVLLIGGMLLLADYLLSKPDKALEYGRRFGWIFLILISLASLLVSRKKRRSL